MNYIVKHKKMTALDKDTLYYMVFKHLSTESREKLCDLLNSFHGSGVLPPSWGDFVITPICKPGKDPNSLNSVKLCLHVSGKFLITDKVTGVPRGGSESPTALSFRF